MSAIRIRLGGVLAASAFCVSLAAPAHALTSKECRAKYEAAKQAGTLGGASMKEFRAKSCVSVSPVAATPSTSASTATAPAAPGATQTAKNPASDQGTGPATFPNAIDPKYSTETPGKARMHTCLDQYKANKAGSGNGGMHWVQKGGGYYSACSKKLKD